MAETVTNKLVMAFHASQGDSVNVTVYDQKADLTAETVQNTMNEVVALETLMNADGHLMDGAQSAKTVKQIEDTLF